MTLREQQDTGFILVPPRRLPLRYVFAAGFVVGALVTSFAIYRVSSWWLARREPPVAHAQQVTAVLPTAEPAGSSIAWMPPAVTRWLPMIREHCADEELAQIIMLVESGGHPTADSGAAAGLMQIAPRWHPTAPRNLYEPEGNVAYGCQYLEELLAKHGTLGDAVYAYNSGGLATAEGRRYRQWVTGMYAERHDAKSPTYARWLDAGGRRLVEAAERGQ